MKIPDTGDLGMVAMFIRSAAHKLQNVADAAAGSARVTAAVEDGYPFGGDPAVGDLESIICDLLAWADRINAQA